MEKIKLLLDTDLGCDIDDCFAIGYALKQEKFEMMGLTTNGGQSDMRAMWADVLLGCAGRTDIPVHVGACQNLMGQAFGGMTTWQAAQLDKYPHRDFGKANTAVEFMRGVIEAYPHEITLASIGNLTNTALLFSRYPHIPALLKGMAVMGGRYADNEFCDISKWGKNEYNIRLDPQAAAMVFSAPVPEIRVVGVEQTCQYHWTREEAIERALQTTHMKPVAEALALTMRPGVDPVWFHDSMAVMMLADDAGMTMSRGRIEVETQDPDNLGQTRFTPDDNGNILLMTGCSPEIFFPKYMKTTGMTRS